MSKKWRGWLIAFLFVFVLSGFAVPAQAWVDQEDASQKSTSSDTGYYFIELDDKPVATYQGGVKGLKATKVKKDEQLNVQSVEVKKYRGYLSEKRNNYKKWLKKKSVKTKVVEEYSLTLNGLAVQAKGVSPATLKQGPGVKKVVKSIQYRPAMNTSHSIIKDRPLWNMGYDGEGIKVAVIDSGIDHKHPFLTDKSLPMPKGYPKEDEGFEGQFTSNKVISARVFSPNSNATPEAIDSHGTHVAGTIAGVKKYKDPSGAAGSKLSGVAPKAYLGNYNVFPCDNCSAESIYIAAAVEAAVRDGFDVANLSLGGPAEPGFDLLAEIVNAATEAGMVVAISAGNEGPGPMTVGSPGTADKVITVAAVSNSHFIGTPIEITVDGEQKTIPVATSSPGGQITKEVEAPIHKVTDGDEKACSGISEDLAGKIALIKRGDCSFTEKALAAQEAKAEGVLLVNNSTGDPSGMSVESEVTIPMVMVTMEDGKWIGEGKEGKASLEPAPVKEFKTENSRLVADFSSRGPTVNYTLKPDVAAVGANVYSSVPGGGLASANGTSMSSPHVAGAAALLKQARPDWTPQDVKGALIGTGTNPKGGSLPLEVGGGIIHVHQAYNTVALASPASLSFGQVKKKEKTVKVTLTNTSKNKQVYRFKAPKSEVDVSASSIRLKKGQSATFTVTAKGSGKRKGQDYQGYINISTDSGQKIRIPYHFRAQ